MSQSKYSSHLTKKMKALGKKITKIQSYKEISNQEQKEALAKLPSLLLVRDELASLSTKYQELDNEGCSVDLSVVFSYLRLMERVSEDPLHSEQELIQQLRQEMLVFDENSIRLTMNLIEKSEEKKYRNVSFNMISLYLEKPEEFRVVVEEEKTEEPESTEQSEPEPVPTETPVSHPVVEFTTNQEIPQENELIESPPRPLSHPISFINPSELYPEPSLTTEVDARSIIPSNILNSTPAPSKISFSWADEDVEPEKPVEKVLTSEETLVQVDAVPSEKKDKRKRFYKRKPREERGKEEGKKTENKKPANIRREYVKNEKGEYVLKQQVAN